MLKDFNADEFDIIIQGGQSNSEGCGLGDAEYPFEPCDDIFMMENNYTIMVAREKVSGNNIVGNFALSFADRYLKSGKLKSGRKLLILLTAVGGTGFCDNRWGLDDDLFLRMIEMTKTAINLNPENRVVAFLWHQGETDTSTPDRDRHYNNLKSLVNKTREVIGNKDVPFIAGDFVRQWKSENLEACKPIIAAIKDVCKDINNATFVETSELQSNDERIGDGDDIHFCREALYSLGHKYYEAWCQIT